VAVLDHHCCKHIAVAHTILTIGYHMLQRGTLYQDLGANYFDQQFCNLCGWKNIVREPDSPRPEQRGW